MTSGPCGELQAYAQITSQTDSRYWLRPVQAKTDISCAAEHHPEVHHSHATRTMVLCALHFSTTTPVNLEA